MTLQTTPGDWRNDLPTDVGRISLAGYSTIIAFACGFGIWAATAPLDGAAIAPGIVAAAGQNVSIQHLEGGIVETVNVEEGQKVVVGEALLTLDRTRPEADLNRLAKQLIALEARSARLLGERDGLDRMPEPAFSTILPGGELAPLVDDQRREFDARLARFRAESEILRQRVGALEESVVGLEAQKKASADQLELVHDEIGRKKALLDKGLTNRSEYTDLLRAEADLIGQVGAITSQLASSASQIMESRQQIERLTTSRVEEAIAELNELRTKSADLAEQIRAAQSILDRTIVRAPTDSIVVRTLYNTPGAVIRPGEPVIELLPTSRDLVIEARLRPADIDVVHLGQAARLRFSALNARTTPEVPGVITYISADRLVDPATKENYYVARLKIENELPDSFDRERIYPGMPVEAMLSTGDRTFLDYLTRPVRDSFNRAFRED
ncbi:MAG: HlyD family type I secretion periplasmic adaptor subunit [Rhizobiaceae bacterium]